MKTTIGTWSVRRDEGSLSHLATRLQKQARRFSQQSLPLGCLWPIAPPHAYRRAPTADKGTVTRMHAAGHRTQHGSLGSGLALPARPCLHAEAEVSRQGCGTDDAGSKTPRSRPGFIAKVRGGADAGTEAARGAFRTTAEVVVGVWVVVESAAALSAGVAAGTGIGLPITGVVAGLLIIGEAIVTAIETAEKVMEQAGEGCPCRAAGRSGGRGGAERGEIPGAAY